MNASSPQKLNRLVPLNALSHGHLQQIAKASRTEEMRPSTQLLASNEHRWLVYLLEGKLSVKESDGNSRTLDSNSENARQPVFSHTAKAVKAKALQPSYVVRIDKSMLQVLMQQEESSSTVVHEFDVDEAGEALFSRVYQAYVDKKLKLPSLPDAALKIREVIKNPDLGVADVARIVQSDPALTARMIQVANSPIYQGIAPVGSVLAAVNRLGGSTTQNLAFVMAVSSLFQSDSAVIQARMTQLYDFSAQLAALCFVIADRCDGLDRERAMLVGLISHIGAIPILSYASEDAAIASNKSVVDNALRNLCCITSGLVLTQWGFDPEVTHICENCGNAQPVDVNEGISYCDVLMAAQLIAEESFLEGDTRAGDFDTHPLREKFGASNVIESRASFLQESQEALNTTRQLLSS